MRIVRRIMLVLLGLIALLLLIGLLLPSHFRVERSILIHAKPEAIYPYLDDPKAWKTWSVWTRRDPAMQISYSGPLRGVNARWTWRSQSEGNGAMTIIASAPNRALGYRLEMTDFGVVSTGSLRLTPAEGGTLLTWAQEGDMNHNPIYRYMALRMDSMVGPDFEAGLAQLKQQLER